MPVVAPTLRAPAYAEMARCVIARVEYAQKYGADVTYRELAHMFRITYADIDAIIGDSDAYGPKLISHAARGDRRVGKRIVEVEP